MIMAETTTSTFRLFTVLPDELLLILLVFMFGALYINLHQHGALLLGFL